MLLSIAAAGEPDVPAPLTEWKDQAYTQRYFLRCDAPGEAGNMGLHVEPGTASVLLPLRKIGGKSTIEPVLLIAEDGSIQPVAVQPVEDGSDVEVFFRTQSGQRRFCLYAGSSAQPTHVSGTKFQPVAMKVKLRGRTAPPDFVFNPAQKLSIERFTQLEQGGAVLGVKDVENIDEPECPFFSIKLDPQGFGHIQRTDNPPRYAALYEGFLRAPVSGKYRFALDTPGVAHVLLNGQAIISADTPDATRLPFALEKTVELSEGLHRIAVHYAEANPEGSTNQELQRFGLRLHWQPPFASALLAIPPQAFARSVPVLVTRFESAPNSPTPYLHVEHLAQVRSGAHRGPTRMSERALVLVKAIGAPPGARLSLSIPGKADEIGGADEAAFCKWIPAGTEVKAALVGGDKKAFVSRAMNMPKLAANSRDVVSLEGELAIKSSPDFLYPDETAHLHMESLLSPAPVIVPKARTETNLIPPPPRPMGEFKMRWFIRAANAPDAAPLVKGSEADATPLPVAPEDGAQPSMPRRKLLLSLPAKDWQRQCGKGNAQLVIQLLTGGLEVETEHYRLLHAERDWPGTLLTARGELRFSAGAAAVKEPAPPKKSDTQKKNDDEPAFAYGDERVLILVPREDESEHRKLAPLKSLRSSDLGTAALFVGDPLVESIAAQPGEVHGLGAQLAKQLPGFTWKGLCIAGPHRHLPIFRMLAAVETFKRDNGGKVPGLVVLALGGGDAARQTPLHTFERALDLLIDRLQHAGARRIIVAGVLPEPERERQAAPYQSRVLDVVRQHHIDGVDIHRAWTSEAGWARRYSIGDSLFGPVPNAEALDEIARMIKDRL